MEQLKKVLSNIGGKGAIGLVLFGGFLVYAAVVDRTVYVSEQMVLLPGSAESTSWENPQQSLIQDLGDFSMYQDFNQANAARLSEVILFPPALEPATEQPADTGEISGGETEVQSDSISDTDDSAGVVPVKPVPEASTESVPTNEPSSDPEPESVPRSESESISLWQLFPLAQETTEELLTDNEPVAPVEVSSDNAEVVETTSEVEAVEIQAPEDNSQSSDELEEISEWSGEVIERTEIPEATNEGAANSESVQETVSDETREQPEDSLIDILAETQNPFEECSQSVNCTSHSIVYSDFNVPEFERGTVLNGIQLRLSLAAQVDRNANSLQRFVVEYSYDGQQTWEVASVIDIDEEISNSINGGFFLASLPTPAVASALSGLSVRVTYQGDVSELEEALVDAVWLQLDSGRFYEEGDPFFNTDTIKYDRSLVEPKFHTLHTTDLDISPNTLPSFTMDYDPQQNFLRRIFTNLFSENTYEVGSIELVDSFGARVEVPFEVVYHDDTRWTVEMVRQPQKMQPGKYQLYLTINENGESYIDVFEFYWGVLAVNTTKSMYSPNEAVALNLAALTDRGDTICNAELYLQITDPANNIYEVPVQQTGACGPNNVTDIPDYIADFRNTAEVGVYRILLEHKNQAGEVVHKIIDSFEVRDYIPYDITRTAPTRIYPPAPYTVTLDITANRSFRGDIVERVPRGFVFAETSGAEVTTLEEATLLTWKDVVLEEGDRLTLAYVFDAPDISPYMYLLGPLDMDGFKETRQWQIASDAISSVAWLSATQTQIGTNLNDTTPGALLWSTSTIDSFFFNHSTSTTPERLFVQKDGDYLVSVNLPVERSDTNGNWTRVGFEVRVNGVVVPHAIGRSGLISNALSGGNRHNQSSSHGNFLLTNLSAGDYIEVYTQALTNVTAARPITITGQASMYVEHIPPVTNVFAATATRTVASTTFNTATSAVEWVETRQDIGYLHSNTVSPEDIIITEPGAYLVHVNMPFEAFGTTNPYRNVLGRVMLDGAQVPGGVFSQGTLIVTADSDNDSSSHWSGVVVTATTSQVLSVTMEREAALGTTTVPAGFEGSIYIQKLPTEDVIALTGRDLSGGTNWNVDPAQSVLWDTQLVNDATVFSHSTTSNTNQITINESGDYVLSFNAALTTTAGTNNIVAAILVNGLPVTGAETKSFYVSNGGGQLDSSGSLVYNLESLSPGDVVTVTVLRDANTTIMNDRTDALLMMWKKKELNFRPGAATMHNVPFDNIRFASTTPAFEFTTDDPDGTSDLVYEFMISTSSDFTGAISRVSDIDSGFTNTASSSDTSPFTEGQRIRYQLQSADELQNNTTYYWRVRAKDVTGSNEFGDWSTTQSLTVDLTVEIPDWFQTTGPQFLSNLLTGVAGTVGDSAVVDIIENTEAILVYGEKTDVLLKYRFWDGDAWGTELNGPDLGAELYWAETSAGNTRDEYVGIFLTADGDTNVMVYSASTSAWGNQNEFETAVNTPTRRGIAVAHETVSGDAIAVSCGVGANPIFTVWNGTSWSATSTITVGTGSDCNWLVLASDPTSDEMILLVKGATNNYEAVVWDGNAWSNNKVLGRAVGTNLNTDGMSVMYEASGDQALVVSSDAGDNEFVYSAWNGTDWLVNINVPVSSDFETGRMVRDQGTDRIGFCMVDDGLDINVFLWDGSAWGGETQLEPLTESSGSRPFDCLFESIPGRDGNFIVPYTDNATDEYQFFDTTWSGPLDMSDLEEVWFMEAVRTGDGTILAVGMENAGIDPLRATEFNGTSWSPSTLIEADPAESTLGTESESFSLSAKRFSFAQGELTTTPINFSSVPGQSTWGDLSFNTTEPLGTSVTVRVKYSDVGVCDAYIPGGVLPGNDTGFTGADSPLNISGLSTSTYNQICLVATIERSGEISASLDEWNVTWVRQPKLIQNQYRWYVNGSFLTPTDPWPFGVVNLDENTPLSSAEAININETIRLRMSLQGLNIDLPQATETFKLQYAEGLTCSENLNWQDVGSSASSTAVWRGYQNSIAGDDWLNAAWQRRIAITVDETLVAEDVTDFPVYLNLADLPSQFFTAVQSDGDDIRITRDDGITEVPYELVSINTVNETGEIHFKANLSSTTDTQFFIYYGNGAATGYAPTDTYGRNNVWTNNFYSVYHLDTNPAVSNIDSTSNGRNLTAAAGSGMNASNSTSSPLGNGVFFDGTNDRLINAGLSWPDANTTVTVTAWNNVSTSQVKVSNLFGFTAFGSERLATHAPWSDSVLYWDYGTCCSSPGRVTANYTAYRNKWTHIALTSQGGGGNFMGIYLDGALVNSLATSDDPTGTLTGFSLGSDNPGGGNHHHGRIDEFRIATVRRSAGWLSTEYNNQINPTGFYNVSSEELVSDGRNLPATVLSASDYPETYEEENPVRENQNLIVVGNDAEWDFVLQNNLGVPNTNYCFRMIYEDGAPLSSYDRYPRLITNAPPLEPDLFAPFDNEQLASTSPWFEFASSDELDDQVSYQIEIDDTIDFSSPVITRDSSVDFAQFENLSVPAERGIYTPGQIVRFIPNTALSNNTTYYWRVRARDDNGSGAYGPWSESDSFTVNTATIITTWYQTTQAQFDTSNLQNTVATVSDDIRIAPGFTSGTTTSTAIEFADVDTGNAWGELLFIDNETTGDIKYSIEYLVAGNEWSMIPDIDLPGNNAGFDTSGVSLANLNVILYHTIRIRAVFTGTDSFPRLENWSITWGERIEIPTIESPFDNAKVSTLTPQLTFTTTDPQLDDLEYEVQVATDVEFSISNTYISGVDGGFTNLTTPLDTSPYNSGNQIQYQFQSPLADGGTYWYRVRARDPLGENAYSDWSLARSFTVDTAVTVSEWHQTTGDQFATGETENLEFNATNAAVSSVIRGAMVAYGESTSVSPRYRLWDGEVWSEPQTALNVDALIEWAEVKAAPTRNEYALGTLGTDGDVNIQIFNVNNNTWGNQVELSTTITNTGYRAMDIAYETVSGELMSVSCEGQDAVYRLWNGSSWTASSTLDLTKATDCEYVKLASDPTSNEIIAVFRNQSTGSPDFEALVWNGSSWGNSITLGDYSEAENEGIAIEYETSGDQAVITITNGTSANFLYTTWNGSVWATVLTQALQNDFEQGVLKRNPASDEMVLCYIDEEADMGTVFWNGAAWDTFLEFEQFGNSKDGGRPVSCEFETTPGREGYLMIPYSDTAATNYTVYATSTFDGELPIGTITDTWTTQTIRTADGLILGVFLQDEGVAPADRYEFAYWDGTNWLGQETLSAVPSVTGTPFHDSISMAAQIFPSVTNGRILSTPINFEDGGSPRFENITFNDTTPGASTIEYRVYYESAPGVFSIISDTHLPGNIAGFTSGPIDLSGLDTDIFDVLQLEARLICDNGDCPTVEDWTVRWSEGISISGTAFQYDQTTSLTGGTVAIAVNGVLQVGKTGEISSSTAIQQAVFATAGSSTWNVPAGVTDITVKAWGAGGGGGAGIADSGAAGGGGGFVTGTVSVTPGETLNVFVGGGGAGGQLGSPAGAGGGGGYSALYRTSTPLFVAAGGGGGGAGSGGISYAGVGTACAVGVASNNCTPTIPSTSVENDVLIAVVHSRTDTVHSCVTDCAGWTEFSNQAGGNGRLSVWYYRQGAGVPPNPTFSGPTTDSFTARIWAFRGVARTGNPFDAVSTNTTQAVANPFVGASISSTLDNVMSVFVGASIDNNTWGPAGGVCTVPNSVDANFYADNAGGNDNSIFLCYNDTPTNTVGPLGVPTMTQVANASDAGRWFTFTLRPDYIAQDEAGAGGAGGGLVGESGSSTAAAVAGIGGSQSAGGTGVGGATSGVSLTGGAGGGGTGGGAGGGGGINGGGAGGTGNGATAAAGGGGGGAGYFGGGGGALAAATSSGAGGGGGSSYIISSATATNTLPGSSSTAGGSADPAYLTGVGVGGAGGATTSASGGAGGSGRVVVSWIGTTTPGVWSIPNVNVEAGDIITVFVTGADGQSEAVAVTQYNGAGDVTGMQLSERTLTLGSADNPTLSNAEIGLYEFDDNEDIFFGVTAGNELQLCEDTTCSDARLRILSGTTYEPQTNGQVINFENSGVFSPGTSTVRVAGSWKQNGTFNTAVSTVIFTATSSNFTLENATSTYTFFNVTFGETTGTATWNLTKPLTVLGTLAVDRGVLARSTTTISVSNNLRVGNGGSFTGMGTTTLAGSGSHVWSDLNASSTNVGHVVIDGTAKTITLGSAVLAQSITIGSDDTLNASGSNHPLTVLGAWTNNNAFIPQGGTVIFSGTSSIAINRGNSAFNNVTFSGVGGLYSFTTPTLALNGSLTIATGTVTLPTGTTTIGRSFTNSGGTFLHNNGEVRMTSTIAGQTITQRADAFFNTFYDLTFTGSGAWSFTETAATTTRNLRMQAGTVTFPSGTLTVGGTFDTTGTGAFAHNNGEVILLVQDVNTVSVRTSAFNNLRTRGLAGAWYNTNWSVRKQIVVPGNQVGGTLTDFPVYVNLANLGADFFSTVKADGSDIRVTTANGTTEVPIEIVSISTSTQSGEMHFRAPTLSTSTSNVFYVYYGNSAAAAYAPTDPFGRHNVWSNGFEAVYHLGTNPASTILDSTRHGRNLVSAGGMLAGNSVPGVLGNAVDFEGGTNDYLRNATFAWANATNSVTVTAWNNVATGEVRSSNLFGFTQSGNERFASHAPFSDSTIYWDFGTCCNVGTSRVQTSYASYLNKWTHIGMVSTGATGNFMGLYLDGSLITSSTGAIEDPSATLTGFGLGALSSAGGGLHDGRIDEFRIASVVRSAAWIAAEQTNQASSTAFYNVGSVENRFIRTFSSANTTILGNVIFEPGGDVTLPTGVLSIGGSFDNNAAFNANNGTVRFNSTAGAETIASGGSWFATLEFNDALGDFTVIEHATASVAVNLAAAANFTVQTGLSLTTLGTFTNAIPDANTVWTGAVLALAGNNDVTTSAKTYGGDVYGTLRTTGTTTARLWNSSATVYDTAASSSIYSQDHAGADGDLYIFGDYTRTTGSEQWSFVTDFDGVALSPGRQVDVRFENGATFVLTNASLFMQGTGTASTTVGAQSGQYSIESRNATINAAYFEVTETNTAGWQLLSSTTLAQFTDGRFVVVPGRSGLTVDAATVDTNPSVQFFGIDFATTTAGAATNVSLTGSPSNFIWFREGAGNLYGEAFDGGDGNPGSIRFDDSSFNITISGTVFSDDGVTPMNASICDNVTPVVTVAVDGIPSFSGPCSSTNGTYSIPNVTYIGDADIAVYLDTNRPGTSTVALRSETTGTGTTNATTGQFTVTKPATVVNGDYLVVIIGKDDSPGITPPAGWTGYTQAGTTGNLRHTGIWYKRVTDASSEPVSYTFTGDVNEVFSFWAGSLAGVSPSNPEDVSFAGRWQQVQNNTAPSAPSLTTQTTNTFVLSAWYVDNDNAVTMPGAPWSTRAANIVSGENNNLSVSSQLVSTPTSTGGVAITGVGGTAETNMAQFAFRRDVATTSAVRAVTVTKTPSTNITNFDLYQSRVIVRHEDVSPMTIADMLAFQFSNDSDVQFTASSSALTVLPNNSLFIWNNKTFRPEGDVTLTGNANNNGVEGTLQIASGGTFTATGNETHTLSGRLVMATTSQLVAASSTFIFNASTTGKSITSPSPVTFNELQFNGSGGGWHITAPLTVQQNINVIAGTVTGTSNLTVENGSFYGNGVVSLGAGTTTINQTSTLGGTTPWTFANLVLGNGQTGTTTPAGTATTTILGRLTIAAAHVLDANNGNFDLAGSGTVFAEQGTFLEDTSTVRYSGGADSSVLNTTYFNLDINAGAGTPTYTAIGAGLSVLNNLTVGGTAPSIFTLSPNNTQLDVNGSVTIASNGTLVASPSVPMLVGGSWQNNGTFTALNGTVIFDTNTSATIAAGNSPFGNLTLAATGAVTITANATTSQVFTIASSTTFTQNSGTTMAVGGQFTNQSDGTNTTWTGSTLSLYGGGQYLVNTKTNTDDYNGTVVLSGTAQPRFWNSSFGSIQTSDNGSLYSMNHAGNNGQLYIYGNYNNATYADHWSYATDFDGVVLGSPRLASVFVAGGGSVTYSSSSLSVVGTSTASTTIQNQGSGTYSLTIASTSAVTLQFATPRNLSSAGITFSGTPNVVDISNVDFLIQTNSASAMTVAGSVIDINPAKNLNRNRFEADTGVSNAVNVTVTGSSVSSWRFTNEYGNRAGEDYDADSGNPGEIVWSDSAALITIAGRVFSDEGSTVSGVCDGVTQNVRLVVAGLTPATTACDGSGNYTFTNVVFSANDSIIVYINGETEKAATVTYQPLSNILNMDLYENRVIVRHEGIDPISIEELAVYDSSDDSDIPFTADTVANPDTLLLPADRKLMVWNNKEFSPNGNITVSGSGAGAAFDGTFEARTGARFTARNGETHTIGGSFIFGSSAVFTAASSTIVLTTDDAARTVDVNNASFNNLSVTGAGSLSVSDTTLTVQGTFTQTNGDFTFPVGTTTIGSSFVASGGDFNINGSPLLFTSTQTGRTVTFGDSDVASLFFNGIGGAWNMTDTNATATASVIIATGTVTLPSGTFTIGGSFDNIGGSIAHNTSELVFTSAAPQIVRARGFDLHGIRQAGAGTLTMQDSDLTLLGSLVISAGSVNLATNTLAVGGSLIAVGGTFESATGTVLFNGVTSGLTINPGVSEFYDLQIGAPSGGYTMSSATTSNNFTLAAVNNFTVSPGATLRVEGVFRNPVGSNTTWTGSTLVLGSETSYRINERTELGDFYDTLIIEDSTDIRFWYSRATTTLVASTASLYSQDHANQNGVLNIYGDFTIGTTTEYWSYATDFDGTSLVGSERKVTVRHAVNATTTVASGALQIIGTGANTTDITHDTTGQYAFRVIGGTFTANHYTFNHLNIAGLEFSGTPIIADLSNGYYEIAVDTGSLITLSSTTLNANASKIFNNVGFNATSPLTGFNVNLIGATDNAWRFTNAYGNIGTEGFDVDGIDACGSVRFDDSACLLTEQTNYRWRSDDGGLGVPDSEWFNTSWNKRKRVRINNPINQAYSSTSVKIAVTYDSDMQTNFTDLRFTADDGVTQIPYWIERFTASTDATVWVRVPSLPANGQAVVHMYYGNSAAITTTSNGATVFEAFEDFESNSLSGYTGDTSLFQTDTAPVFGGTFALEASNKSGKTTDGIFRFDRTVSQGQIIRYMHYVDTAAGSGDEMCTLFGVQSPGTTNENYAVCLELFGTDRIALSKDVENNDVSGTVLASSNVTYTTGWYEVEIDWRTNNTINVSLYNPGGVLTATTSATDSSYTSGGIGFAFWFNYGAWDSYTARVRTATQPEVFLGAEQERGGASWRASLNTAAGGIPGETLRLRLAVENSGLEVTQSYQLEYAPKGVAPSCEAVLSGSFTPVPNQASCGSSPVCMQTTTQYANNDTTSDLLFGTTGFFVAGAAIESPSSITNSLTVDQNNFTELEYTITPTINAADSYCFRVTNNGTPLDFYNRIPELGLQFDPFVDPVNFNDGMDIDNLTPGTTTTIYATSTVTDFNGFSDLVSGGVTIFRSGVGAACVPDNNNCYVETTDTRCNFTQCSGNSCELVCAVDIFFHADPTDILPYLGEEWFAFMEVRDAANTLGFNDNENGIELLSMRAIDVIGTIDYGALAVNEDTGSFNPSTSIVNLGNVEVNIDVQGTDLTDGVNSFIPAEQQRFATSTFTYSSCGLSCEVLSSSTPVAIDVDLFKPTSVSPPITDQVYWGIAIPLGTNSAAHQGFNIFTPISP